MSIAFIITISLHALNIIFRTYIYCIHSIYWWFLFQSRFFVSSSSLCWCVLLLKCYCFDFFLGVSVSVYVFILQKPTPVSFIVDIWRLFCCCYCCNTNSVQHHSACITRSFFSTKFLCRIKICLCVSFFALSLFCLNQIILFHWNNDEIILLLIMCNNHINPIA